MSYHDTTPVGSIHIPYNWTFANATARTGVSGLVSTDVGKFARQLDDNSLWMLIATTPTWTPVGGGAADSGYSSDQLTYTDTSNKVVGPLLLATTEVTKVTLLIMSGISQQYVQDYTVRLVTGGSAPGYYICIATTSTAPGGGSFSGGSNPSTGIDSILTNGDIVRALYPI